MHRIDTSGNVNNRWSEGNPQAGQLATRGSAAWFNDVQENIIEVLEQAAIVPVKGAENQLYLAIVALIAAATAGTGGAVPITRLVNAAGLAVGGGALANDITLTVPKALAADVVAGTNDLKAITPLALKDGMTLVASANGYTRLPNGLILQWGQANANPNATTVVTLPTTFPAFCVLAVCNGGLSGDATQTENNPFVTGRGTGSISVWSPRNEITGIDFLALGY